MPQADSMQWLKLRLWRSENFPRRAIRAIFSIEKAESSHYFLPGADQVYLYGVRITRSLTPVIR